MSTAKTLATSAELAKWVRGLQPGAIARIARGDDERVDYLVQFRNPTVAYRSGMLWHGVSIDEFAALFADGRGAWEIVAEDDAAERPDRVETDALQEATFSLVGKTIVAVRYRSADDAQERGWRQRGGVLELNDGTRLYAMADEEGNDAGVLVAEQGDYETAFLGRIPC